MSYVPYSEPSATFTSSNFVVYTTKFNLTSGSYYPVFTTENGLGHFCVTDVYFHYEPSAWLGTDAIRLSLGANDTGNPGTSYNNIVNETGPRSGLDYNFDSVPTLATTTVLGQGTTVNSNTTVYVRTLQNTALKTNLSGTIIVGGFYSRLPTL